MSVYVDELDVEKMKWGEEVEGTLSPLILSSPDRRNTFSIDSEVVGKHIWWEGVFRGCQRIGRLSYF